MSKATGLPKHQVKLLKALVGKRIVYEKVEFTFILYNDYVDKKQIEIMTHTVVFRFRYSQVEHFLDSIIRVTTNNHAKERETDNDHPQDRAED